MMPLHRFALLALGLANVSACSRPASPRFEVSFPQSLSAHPVTGHVFISIYTKDDVEPRVAAYQSSRDFVARVPFFAADVDSLKPGESAVVDTSALGYPLGNLRDLPAGDYYVQAVMNVYTQYHRTDGHTIWARQGDWDGQRWAYSPGNLVSQPVKVHLDPAQGYDVKLQLDHALPAIDLPADTKWVKHLKIQSPMLTKWWGGAPQYLGATVLLPKGYDTHPNTHYPVLYLQDHFNLDAPYGFTEDSAPQRGRTVAVVLEPPNPRSNVESAHPWSGGGKRESGYEFYKSWISDKFPGMIIVTFQHPTQFFDDSYAVNSVNDGPYGDAIMQELIPEVERRYRIIAAPYARVLSGGSTGGWESLALQLYHPEFFGGTWTFFPDPIDFRRYQLIDIYADSSYYITAQCRAGRARAHDANELPRRAAHGHQSRRGADGDRLRDEAALGVAVRCLERGVRPRRRRWLPEAPVRPQDRGHRSLGRARHARQRVRSPLLRPPALAADRAQARGQIAHPVRRYGRLLPRARRVHDAG